MNDELELKVEEATKLAELRFFSYSERKLFSRYSSIYPFTVENLKGSFSNFDFRDKSILTVCGSGDSVLNSILFGAKLVDAFDINELALLFYKLKEAAIKALSYEEYMKYFYLPYSDIGMFKFPDALGINFYQKILPFLDPESRIFWDNLYLKFNNDGYTIRKSKLFSRDCYSEKTIININNYLTRDNYYKLRDNINNCQVNTIVTDIKELKDKLNRKYDLIFLSNIAKYIPYIENGTEKEIYEYDLIELTKFKDMVMRLKEFLNPNGTLSITYLFNFLKQVESSDSYAINKQSIRDIVFPKDEFQYIAFDGVDAVTNLVEFGETSDEKDGLIIYQKK